MNAFRYRTVECPDCFEGRYERPEGPGYVSCKCETCEGEGEFPASCGGCDEYDVRLNDEGFCRACVGLVDAPVRDLGDGRMGVEL